MEKSQASSQQRGIKEKRVTPIMSTSTNFGVNTKGTAIVTINEFEQRLVTYRLQAPEVPWLVSERRYVEQIYQMDLDARGNVWLRTGQGLAVVNSRLQREVYARSYPPGSLNSFGMSRCRSWVYTASLRDGNITLRLYKARPGAVSLLLQRALQVAGGGRPNMLLSNCELHHNRLLLTVRENQMLVVYIWDFMKEGRSRAMKRVECLEGTPC